MRRSSWAVVGVAGAIVVAAFAAGLQTSRPASERLQAGAGAPGQARPDPPFRGRMWAHEHQFYVRDDEGEPAGPWSRQSNGLADLLSGPSGGVIVHTGISSGDVWLTVEGRREAPASIDTAAWEEVVELSVRALGRLEVAAMAADVDDPFPVLNPAGPGDIRLRVHARGRDHNEDGVDFEPVEEYLIVAWPAPLAPEVAHKQTDGYGADFRRSSARQPPAPSSTGPPPVPPPQQIP